MGLPYTDDFSGGAGALGLMSDGQLTWGSFSTGSWTKDGGGEAYANAADARILADFGVADNIRIKCVFADDGGSSTAANVQGLVFRGSSAGDFYKVAFYYGVLYLQKWTGGVAADIDTESGLTPVTGDELSVELSGTSVLIKLNSTVMFGGAVTLADYTTNTHHGLAITDGVTSKGFDSFTVESLGGGGGGGAAKHYYGTLLGQR